MARRHKHEEHLNHEAWAIPYGDLITLLLAFFVVMYAMSSINEGKYRVLSDSLAAAFRGSPKTMQPIQVGEKQVGSGADIKVTLVQQGMLEGQPRSLLEPPDITDRESRQSNVSPHLPGSGVLDTVDKAQLDRVATDIEAAMRTLIDDNLVVVRRHGKWVEVEIRTDILFPSGVATLAPAAENILRRLADSLRNYANPVRVEGHTDNVPIRTTTFPSNWELSAARAATVVHLFTSHGIAPSRLAVIGLGEYRPAESNDTAEGRNANRRVVLVILDRDTGSPEGSYADQRGDDPVAELPPPAAPEEEQPAAAAPLPSGA